MQGWSVLCSGRFDRVMLLLLHREGATSGRQQKTTSPRACGPSEREAGYPRVCGATPAAAMVRADPEGLSPRVRGNRSRLRRAGLCQRPIPACAGQPSVDYSAESASGAYPRVCGATSRVRYRGLNVRGLSPRVRGNRDSRRRNLTNPGPIPACAGQPGRGRTPLRWSRAYPRVCGATSIQTR